MKSYDALSDSRIAHKKRVKLQNGEYKGSFTYEDQIFTSKKGLEVLYLNLSDCDSRDVKEWVTTDCEIIYDDFKGSWYVTLTNPETGHKKTYRLLHDEDFERLVVGIEIIDYEPEAPALPLIGIDVAYYSECKGEADK